MEEVNKKSVSIEEAIKIAEKAINTNPKSNNKDAEKTSDTMSDFDKFRQFVNSGRLIIKQQDGKAYLLAEAWLYLAHIKGLIPSVETTMKEIGGHYVVKACCVLRDIKTYEVVSQSDMVASSEEEFLSDKPLFAVYGLAETRAISRAVRNVYGYIAKGAGFETVPASEVGLERGL